MTILDDILRALGLAAQTPPPAVDGAPIPATPTHQEPLTSVTVAALRAMLDEHDRGIFARSALLADLCRRDADVAGALTQRVLAFEGLCVEVEPAPETPTDADLAAAVEYDTARDAIVPQAAITDMAVDAVLLGFAVGQLVPTWDDATQRLTRRLEPWPAASVEHDSTTGVWYALTQDRGRIPITPGDGLWVLYAPRGHRAPWLWGALRAVAEWVVRGSDAASDASRRAEVHGNAVWKAKIPSGARQTTDGRAFATSLRTMGRNAVIPCPQSTTPEMSYDVELIEAAADAHAIFEWLLRCGGGRIRLAILGQDLTSQNNTVGTNASSETGLTTLDRVVKADGQAWGACETAQIAAPRARYLGTPPVRVCLEPEERDDRTSEATAQKAVADAAAAWRALGVAVDVAAMAQRARVPVLTTAPTPAPITEDA